MNAGLTLGSVIVFDDARLGINARLWQGMLARVFGMLTQGFRYKQILTFITVPDEVFIERQSRRLVHIRFESTDVQDLMKMKLLSRNTFDHEHPLAKFPRIHRGISEIVVKMVKFQLPSKDLWEKYEAKKKEYMESRFREFQEQLNLLDGGNMVLKNGKPGVELTCDNCGYTLPFTGHSRSPRCPSCNSRVYIAEVEDRLIDLRCRYCGYTWKFTGSVKFTHCPSCDGYVSIKRDGI